VGSIPIARSITPADAVGIAGFHHRNQLIKRAIADAVGRGFDIDEFISAEEPATFRPFKLVDRFS
jgi:hypothetical protein